MKVPDFFDRCIVCCEKPVGDPEHIVPQCIGGRLKARILCQSCNNTFGSRLVAGLKRDPSMRLAFEVLSDQIPDRIKRQWCRAMVGRAEDNSIIHADATEGIRVLPSKGSGDSLIKGVEEAKRDIEKILSRRGFKKPEIAEQQQAYDQLPNDTTMTLPDGTTLIKRTCPPLHADLRGQFTENLFPALIAFEFWAIVVGKSIYGKAFDPVREYIRNGTISNDLTVENLRGPKYDCVHRIGMDLVEGCIGATIQLFRAIAYRVILRGYDYHGADSLYYQDLRTAESFLARTKSDAACGNWITE